MDFSIKKVTPSNKIGLLSFQLLRGYCAGVAETAHLLIRELTSILAKLLVRLL